MCTCTYGLRLCTCAYAQVSVQNRVSLPKCTSLGGGGGVTLAPIFSGSWCALRRRAFNRENLGLYAGTFSTGIENDKTKYNRSLCSFWGLSCQRGQYSQKLLGKHAGNTGRPYAIDASIDGCDSFSIPSATQIECETLPCTYYYFFSHISPIWDPWKGRRRFGDAKRQKKNYKEHIRNR